jgi:Universal stress protein family
MLGVLPSGKDGVMHSRVTDHEAAAGPRAAREPAPVFRRILCAVNGSRSADAAVDHAIALARAGSHVQFVAVTATRGSGLFATTTLSVARAPPGRP